MIFDKRLKHALAAVLLAMGSNLPAIAQQASPSRQLADSQPTPTVLAAAAQRGNASSQAYAPLAQIGAPQTQIIYYRDESAGAGRSAAANVYVDGELQTALLPHGYTAFCVKPGEHTLGAYINEAPLYTGKTTEHFSAELKGGMTYFLKVAPAGSDGAPVVMSRNEAEAQLQGMHAQTHVLSRASAVEACNYLPASASVQPG